MRASLMIIAVVVLLAVAEARYYRKINNEYVAYVDWERSKRQSHPDSTIARIPQIPFGDLVNNEASPGGVGQNDAVPVPAEYLTPPAPDSALQPQPQQPPPPPDSWNSAPQQPTADEDMAFDAGDILVPPPNDQAAQYDTLKLYTLVPKSSQPEGDLEGFGPAEQESAVESRTPFIDSYRPQWQPQPDDADADTAQSPSNKPSVHSFVKTDPHGHFKWGVHIGH